MSIEDEGIAVETGEPEARDHSERTEAALDAWNHPEETSPEKPAETTEAAPEKPSEQAAEGKQPEKPAEKPPEERTEGAAADITKAPFFNEPAFQEFYKKAQEHEKQIGAFREVFDQGRYTIKDTPTLKAVHEDAFTLYDIASGKEGPERLFEMFKKNWEPEIYKDVLSKVVALAEAEGVTAAAGGEGKKDDASGDSALAKEVRELRAELDSYKKSSSEESEKKERMATVVEPMMKKIEELARAKDVTDAEDVEAYVTAIGQSISALPAKDKNAILEQIKSGKWSEVERHFTEYHNRMVARAVRLANAKTDKAIKENKEIPRVPAGGGAPTPREKRRDLRTSEGRTSAALEEFNKK